MKYKLQQFHKMSVRYSVRGGKEIVLFQKKLEGQKKLESCAILPVQLKKEHKNNQCCLFTLFKNKYKSVVLIQLLHSIPAYMQP